MTVTFAGDACTFTSTSPPNDLDDCVSAVSNASLMDLVIPEARIFIMDDVKFIFNTSSAFTDEEFALHQTKDNGWSSGVDRTVEWATGTVGIVTWGNVDNSDIFQPIIWGDAWYFYNITFTPGNVFWSNQTFGAGTQGDFRMYGGVFDGSPRGSAADGQFFYMPTTRTDLIGLMSERWGGQRCWGTNYIVRDVIQKGGSNNAPGGNAGPYGFSLGGITTVDDALFDITLENSNFGFYFYDNNGGNVKGVSLRELDADLAFNAATAAMDVNIDDSDPYTTYGNIGGNPASGVTVRERTTYNATVTEEDGSTAIENARIRIWRTVPSTTEITAGAAGVGELTDSGGIPVSGEMLLQTTQWDGDGGAPSGSQQTSYGPYNLRLRDYGRTFISETKIPQPPAPIIDAFALQPTGLTQDGVDDSTVSGYTGIDYNEGATEIQVTELHTLADIYSFGQYNYQASGQMDVTDSAIPFITFNNLLYTIISGWTMTNIDTNVDIELSVLELSPGGDRWVPIKLSGMIELANHYIEDTDTPVVLYEAEVDTTGEFITKRFYDGNINTLVRVRLQGYTRFVTTSVISNTGMIVGVNQRVEPEWRFNDGRTTGTHFRWRNDNGNEIAATYKAAEDVNITGQAKNENVRLRLQSRENRNKDIPQTTRLQYKLATGTTWVDIT